MSNALELAQLASLVTVDASSNIGIGTTTSARSALLTIKDPNQNITSGNGQLAIITSDAVGANIGGALILGGQSAGAADWVFGSISGRSENNAYAGYLSFGVSNAAGSHAEAMRITSGGTVGIGTTAPGAMLDIDGGAGNLVIRRYGAQPSTSWFRAEGTQASPTAIASSSTIAQLVARGYDGASYRITSYMDFISDGAISSTSSPGYIRFWTTPSGTVSPVERLRIDSAGNVGIGVTPSAWGVSPFIDFPVYGFIGGSSALSGNSVFLGTNAYYATAAWRYKASSLGASYYQQNNGQHLWFQAPSGTAGNAITFTQAMSLDAAGNLLLTGGGGLGYGTGSGGTVTQLTSKATAVTLNKPTGQITMNNAALAAGASVLFAVNNNLLTTNDNVLLTINYPVSGYNYRAEIAGLSPGAFQVRVTNISGGSLSEAVVLNFAIIKGATA